MIHKNTLWIFFLVAAFFLNGCDLSKNYTKIDRESDMEFQDYRDHLGPRDPVIEDDASLDSGVPPLMSYVSPVSEDLKAMPLVSVNLNQTVPLRDALFELAKEADYDLELDPNIHGSIIFTARNKPFDKVIERIATLADLRYEFDEDSLRIQVDSPYTHIYKLDYLNIIRQSTSSISNDVSVVSGEGTDTGSRFETQTTSESDFWQALEASIGQILDVSVGAPTRRTGEDPQITVAEPRPVPAGEVATVDDGSQPQAVLQVDSLPVSTGGDTGSNTQDNGGSRVAYSINRQAGTLMVYAPKKVQDKVVEYLDTIRRTMTSQVLIEAKVLEVTLNDEFAAGIDWDAFDFFGQDIQVSFNSGGANTSSLSTLARNALDPATNPTTDFRLGIFGHDAQAVVDMVSRFGVVKALASPRLTVLNNQSAVLNVATNLVFFEIDIETQVDEGVRETTVDSDIQNVPEGVLINVHPSIDLETNTISMALRPTVTRVVSSVADPGVAFIAAEAGTDVESLIPQVNVQEIDSVIRINSGEAIVMGGLMQDRTESTQNSLPGLGELPLAGALFRNQRDSIQKTELVIFLKATIVENGNTVHDADRDIYRTFSKDRHPFKL